MSNDYNTVKLDTIVTSVLPNQLPTSSSQNFPQVQTHQKVQPNIGRSRPQSFAQKLRSTGKTVKGKLGKHNFLFKFM